MDGSAEVRPHEGGEQSTLVDVRPVAVLQARRCADDRYPALAGAWAVGCVGSDDVNVAVSLTDGRVVTLTDPVRSPALGDGWLWAPGHAAGAWVLPRATRGEMPGVGAMALVPYTALGAPAVRRTRADATASREPGGDPARGEAVGAGAAGADPLRAEAVVPYADHVDVIDLGKSTWPRYSAYPLPGEPVAIGAGWAAWTERGANGEDVWIVGASARASAPRVLVGGAGDQHDVAGAGDTLWYVDDTAVWKYDVESQATASFPADAGFEAPLAVSTDGSLACWEDRRALKTGGDIDIRCTSMLHVERPGDQRWPSLGGGFLMWREGNQVIVGRVDQGRSRMDVRD